MFRRIEVVEFDVLMSDHGPFPTRVELFQSQGDSSLFRVRLWQLETYRIQPRWPADPESHEPAEAASDEEILVERSHYFHGEFDPLQFRAPSPDSALEMAMAAYERFLTKGFGRSSR